LVLVPHRAALVIGDPQDALVHPAELERSEVSVPQPIAGLFEPDVLAGEGVRDADPAFLPADPTGPADEPHFKVAGIVQRRELPPFRPTAESDAGAVPEADGKFLRILLLADGETVHNAFFDRGFEP
jgi:hypothetical protein